MTEKAYRDKIERATKSLGVYRVEFTRTRARLARLYVRIEELDSALADGKVLTFVFNDKGVKELTAEAKELDRLNDQALTYERALGLTADSVKKINDGVFAPKEVDPFAAQLAAIRRHA